MLLILSWVAMVHVEGPLNSSAEETRQLRGTWRVDKRSVLAQRRPRDHSRMIALQALCRWGYAIIVRDYPAGRVGSSENAGSPPGSH